LAAEKRPAHVVRSGVGALRRQPVNNYPVHVMPPSH
jgi:hypothetical protein